MERTLYKKALGLATGGRVAIEEETDKAVYFAVRGESDEHKVRVQRDHTVSCTCPYFSLRGVTKGAHCSHVIAALLVLSGVE